eukprot:CAMPEP_0171213674 /NCGR_PEP_ID=MMETSP0790-20130122/30768_1 /TAXON_ID=2925 /ORGANISM="Alexandrium catenella, Strain OF101" /LENGTH=43 /DNA_ID= /DNA_START= /DNA_END= /DNA_ORIENTATION=
MTETVKDKDEAPPGASLDTVAPKLDFLRSAIGSAAMHRTSEDA